MIPYMNMKLHNERGEISKVLLLLAGAVLVVIVIIFVSTKFLQSNGSSGTPDPSATPSPTPQFIHETQMGNIKFTLISFQELGSVLKGKSSYEQDLTTTGRFVKVVIGAQNKGKNNTEQYGWDLGNVIDSEGRNFLQVSSYSYITGNQQDTCGAILKPDFDPVACTRIYEVSKLSAGLKVELRAGGTKKQKTYIDLTY